MWDSTFAEAAVAKKKVAKSDSIHLTTDLLGDGSSAPSGGHRMRTTKTCQLAHSDLDGTHEKEIYSWPENQ